jgi:tripartite-type tricarboxylate transporter receptor subunit TctC
VLGFSFIGRSKQSLKILKFTSECPRLNLFDIGAAYARKETDMNKQSRLIAAGLLACASLFSGLAGAQISGGTVAYPQRPLKLVVGYPPGGNNDIIARIVAKDLADSLQQPVIVENRPGAAGRIAGEYVARSAPDGYTLLVGATGPMVYAPGLYTSMQYDAGKDFRPITLLGSTPMVLAVNKSFPATSISGFVSLAKQQDVQYAQGATPFLVAAESFKKLAGLRMVAIPYKGNVQAVTAAVSGEVQMVVADVPTLIAQLNSGGLRALAVTGPERSKYLPNVPTLAESGFAFEGISWTGLFAPAGTSNAVINLLHARLAAILTSPSIQQRLTQLNFETAGIGMSPQAFGEMHRKDLNRWVPEIRRLGIIAD